MLNDQEFMRYSRQLLLEDIGPEGQAKLKASKVLIVGLGGLGSPAALYLAAAGVGHLYLADDDQLHISNLQRQILYRTGDIPANKATLAGQQLTDLNPLITVTELTERQDNESLLNAVRKADLVLDCCDNMATRHAINAACVAENKPLISGSAVGFSGQLMVITPPYQHGCYACLYPDQEEPQRNCRTAGVLGPIVGVIGTLQSLEAIKMLTGFPSSLNGKLRLFDGKQQSWSTLQLTQSSQCPVCRVVIRKNEAGKEVV
ncbi:HesA/MoeB/ThiF family protein [Xenorhabdus nematophila]|uniref:Adenylation of ThiS with ThiI, thiolation of ThiS in thiazole synthesis n=1 Tax=Xenorhabdus nematophila (strain ATCC 19061 / DSM 3370 / CCUG 14189 / LMG 1036 / NCIMB 9965 / AN6) TaxID=406817 RepID=D3VJA2_XENNA|nr:HesA/MoeB/ThiF family protein [Xenorhabdus nematophila]CEE90344.1 adenylation of ThiS; with ThiI, thiolation of ThiS; in thiazole synthesis [Xenorhabdus nematophila str. Anatoliense]CEF29472.1 adenylation of ThiS; with ThiI, thiolation of ThiS; in thiazole synthesis [Xenorhabdus nematophila str. Websteri]AYA41243.1 HesA/MoeB/ThiF family protein [Xenorhabdus nematophila]KHD28120.1 molybdopterin-synthase adenylyltransferase [Xenorhabdus nematophila]MBA0019983.1 HesA/MoeB/ThiF family protein [